MGQPAEVHEGGVDCVGEADAFASLVSEGLL
jgi:hypothetical protein